MIRRLAGIACCAALAQMAAACGGDDGDAHLAITGTYTRYTTSLLNYGNQTYIVTVDTVSIPVTGELTIHPANANPSEPQTATFTGTIVCPQSASYSTAVSFTSGGFAATLAPDASMNPNLKIHGSAAGDGYSGTMVCVFQTASSWTYSGTFTAVREK